MLPAFNYVRAKSVADAVRLLAVPGARVHAGGTDLLGCLRDGVFKADRIVSLAGIKELRGIAPVLGGGLQIGALTPNAEVAVDKTIQRQYTALAQAAAAVASPQLRNQGTIGGNLCQRPRCWYLRGEFHCARKGGDTCFAMGGENQYHCILGGDKCVIVHPSDIAPALVSLGARIQVVGPGGARLVPAGSFFLGPAKALTKENVLEKNEIVTTVFLPPPEPSLKSSYRKVRARNAWDFALAGVALALLMKGDSVVRARVVLSGAAPIPWRSEPAERALTGKTLSPEVVTAAAEAAVHDATPLEKNGYRIPMFKGLLTEALQALA